MTRATTATRAAVYCRISDDRDGTALGVDRQERACHELCDRRGWTVAAVYVDNDISASSGKRRPQYEAMLAAVAAREVDAIVAYASDRLYRVLPDLVAFTKLVTSTGVEVETVAAGVIDLSTATGRFTANVIGSAAQFEVEKTSERQKLKMAELAQNGRPHGGKRSFGFERDGVNLRDDEVAVIRNAVDAILHGATLRSVTRRMNAAGLRTSNGNSWEGTALRRLLVAPRLNGRREHEVDGVVTTYPAAWPKIVSDDEHAELVALFSGRTSVPKSTHVLSGLLVCGKCGAKLAWQPARHKADGKVKTADAYQCPSGDRGCGGVSINAAGVERYVVEYVGRIRSAVVERGATNAPSDGVASLVAERDALRARLDGFAEDYALGRLDARQIDVASRVVRDRIANIDVRIAAGAAVTVTATRRASLVQRWATLDNDERREAIRSLVDHIDIGKGRPHTFDAAARLTIVQHFDTPEAVAHIEAEEREAFPNYRTA
jgi:site-specific DNA recombinase